MRPSRNRFNINILEFCLHWNFWLTNQNCSCEKSIWIVINLKRDDFLSRKQMVYLTRNLQMALVSKRFLLVDIGAQIHIMKMNRIKWNYIDFIVQNKMILKMIKVYLRSIFQTHNHERCFDFIISNRCNDKNIQNN